MAGRAFTQEDWDNGNYALLGPDARHALALAQKENERSGHRWNATPEHLLIGLTTADGPAQALLLSFGIDADVARARLGIVHEDVAGQWLGSPTVPPSRTAYVIRRGFHVARMLSCDSVGGEHLLLGILIDGDSAAAHLLETVGAGLEPACRRLGTDPRFVSGERGD
jgi:ATP-dependent Clp protease ATP-binding subunit ClpA